MLFAAAMAILRTHVLPRWLAWPAITIAVRNFLVTFAALLEDGWLSPVHLATVVPYALFMLWPVAAAKPMICPAVLLPGTVSLETQGSKRPVTRRLGRLTEAHAATGCPTGLAARRPVAAAVGDAAEFLDDRAT
jgi:hypothetical protein